MVLTITHKRRWGKEWERAFFFIFFNLFKEYLLSLPLVLVLILLVYCELACYNTVIKWLK